MSFTILMYSAIVVGTIVGAVMSIITEYYTAMGKRPVLSIIQAIFYRSRYQYHWWFVSWYEIYSDSLSSFLAGWYYGSYHFAGLYGVAIAAAGMMATTAMQLGYRCFRSYC
jgi:K(+)-stimulated pyrophosphate-energized sodium pump